MVNRPGSSSPGALRLDVEAIEEGREEDVEADEEGGGTRRGPHRGHAGGCGWTPITTWRPTWDRGRRARTEVGTCTGAPALSWWTERPTRRWAHLLRTGCGEYGCPTPVSTDRTSAACAARGGEAGRGGGREVGEGGPKPHFRRR